MIVLYQLVEDATNESFLPCTALVKLLNADGMTVNFINFYCGTFVLYQCIIILGKIVFQWLAYFEQVI